MRIGVLGLQFDGLLQRLFDLGAKALSQRFGYADALAITAQGVSLPVVGVGVFRIGFLLRFCALGDFHEHVQLGLFLGFQIVGINALRFIGNGHAVSARFYASVMRLLKLTVVEQNPGSKHRRVFW